MSRLNQIRTPRSDLTVLVNDLARLTWALVPGAIIYLPTKPDRWDSYLGTSCLEASRGAQIGVYWWWRCSFVSHTAYVRVDGATSTLIPNGSPARDWGGQWGYLRKSALHCSYCTLLWEETCGYRSCLVFSRSLVRMPSSSYFNEDSPCYSACSSTCFLESPEPPVCPIACTYRTLSISISSYCWSITRSQHAFALRNSLMRWGSSPLTLHFLRWVSLIVHVTWGHHSSTPPPKIGNRP